jgi:hypothetical protein
MLLAGKLRYRMCVEANAGITFAGRDELETTHVHRPHLCYELLLIDGRHLSVPRIQFEGSAPHLKAGAVLRLQDHVIMTHRNHVAHQSWNILRIAALGRGFGKDASTYFPRAIRVCS